MPRVAITIRVTPPVLELLTLLAMRETPERRAADVLNRWCRRRLDDPAQSGAMHHMVTAVAEDGPALADCTVALTLAIEEPTAEALRRHHFRSMSAEAFASFLVDRWAHWHELQRQRPPLIEMDGLPE